VVTLLTDKEKLAYYKKQEAIKQTILRQARKKRLIVYGAEAANKHLPPHLEKPSRDVDLYVRGDPLAAAVATEKSLDRRFGGDFFYVKPAKHRGTFKVKSRVTLDGVADFTKQESKVPTKVVGGVRYATLGYQRGRLQAILRDRGEGFRHKKDREQLQRINLFLQSEGGRKLARQRANVPIRRDLWGNKT